MNELERIRERVAEIRLSLEAINSVNRSPLPVRSLSEALKDWEVRPARLSEELRRQVQPYTGEISDQEP